MASIEKIKSKNKTSYRIRYKDKSGKLKTYKYNGKGTFHNKKLAEKVKRICEEELDENLLNFNDKNIEITDFFKLNYERSYVSSQPSYKKRIRAYMKNILSYLKESNIKYLSEINIGQIEDYRIMRLKSGIKTKTINDEVFWLKSALNKAVSWKIIKSNPLDELKPLKVTDQKKIKSLTKEQINLVYENLDEEDWLYPVFTLGINTGMRIGELCNLEWEDVNFERKIINVHQKEGFTPKSSGKVIEQRTIPINEKAMSILKKLYGNSENFKDDYVLRSFSGTPLLSRYSGIGNKWKRLAQKLGSPEITQVHLWRRTFITYLLHKTKNPEVVRRISGHKDLKTMQRYIDTFEDMKQSAMENFNL